MGREGEATSYPQNRIGNQHRELDEYRARDGAFLDIAAGDTGGELVLYDFPDDVQEVHVVEIHYFDQSGSAAEFDLRDASLDSSGNITGTSTQITPQFTVSASSDRVIQGMVMQPFVNDAVAIQTDSESEVRVGLYADSKQYHEAQSEITGTP